MKKPIIFILIAIFSVFIFTSPSIGIIMTDCVETWEQIRPHYTNNAFFAAQAWFKLKQNCESENKGLFGFNYRPIMYFNEKIDNNDWKETTLREIISTEDIPPCHRRTVKFYQEVFLDPGIYEYQGFYYVGNEKREGNIQPLLVLPIIPDPLIVIYDFKQYTYYDNEVKNWCYRFKVTLQRYQSNDSNLYLDFYENGHPFFSLLLEDEDEYDGKWFTIIKEIPVIFFTRFLGKGSVDFKTKLRLDGDCDIYLIAR